MWVGRAAYKKLGTLLARVRKDAGVSQVELANRLGKPQSFVSAYEGGQRRIDVIELQLVCDALGIDAGELFQQITEVARTVRVTRKLHPRS